MVTGQRPRALGWIVFVAAACGGLAALVMAAPSLVRDPVESEANAAIDCVNAQAERGEGDPHTCLESDTWASIAGMLQEEARVHAQERRAVVRRMAEKTALEFAAVRDFDPSARDDAARALLGATSATPDVQLYELVSANDLGAWEPVLEHADASDGEALTFDAVFDAAFMLGEPERLVPFARAHAHAKKAPDFNRVRAAALLCWLGERDAAAEAISAIREHARDQGLHDARTLGEVELYCGLTRSTDLRLEHTYEVEQLQRRIQLRTSTEPLEENAGLFASRSELAMHVGRLAHARLDPMPTWSLREVERDAEILLAHAVRLQPATGRNAKAHDGGGMGAEPQELLEGAEALLKLAESAAIHRVFDDADVWPLPSYTQVERPQDALRWAAFCLTTFAIEELRWRGASQRAHEAIALAKKATPTDVEQYVETGTRLYLLPALAELDPTAAAALLRTTPPTSWGAGRVSLWGMSSGLATVALQSARHQGDDALAKVWVERAGNGIAPRPFEAGEWAYAAARAFGPLKAPPEGGTSPSGLNGTIGDETAVLTYWRAVAAEEDPAARDLMRWHSRGKPRTATLGAVGAVAGLELLARAAPQHVEQWLPIVSASMVLDPLQRIRALRKTFAVLGHEDLEARWAEREAAIVSRLTDRDAAALYRLLR